MIGTGHGGIATIAIVEVCTGTGTPVKDGGPAIAMTTLRQAGAAMDSVLGIGDAEGA